MWLCAAGLSAALWQPALAQTPSATEQELTRLRAQVCSTSTAAPRGLQGEYFAQAQWRTPLFKRLDARIDFPQGLGAQVRSARWTGWIRPFTSGRYRLGLATDAGTSHAQLMVAMQSIGPDTEIEMQVGRYYPIRIELPHHAGPTTTPLLQWTAPGSTRTVVPAAALYAPTTTVGTRNTKPS